MGKRLAATVAVVGGGYAGMAAAVALAERGVRATVFEAAAMLGGRARRAVSMGTELDNGQHILIGAYTELFHLMAHVGVPSDAVLRMPLEVRYARDFHLRRLWLPEPLGLAGGILLASGIPLAERLGAVRFIARMRRLRFRLEEDISVALLLERHRQAGAIGHYLWRPLCVSALNTPAAIASANVFLAVLRDTLAGAAEASDLLLPRVNLSRLFPEPAADYVRAKGGEVRLQSPVKNLAALRQSFDQVIVAVGPQHVRALLPDAPEHAYQPIYTCYLQYGERLKLPLPMIGMARGIVQWAFDRGALLGEKGRLACVISAQGDHQQMSQEEIGATCHRELLQERLVAEEPRWSRVIAEKRATIACVAGIKKAPPPTALGGVVLAGDYTDPEYPPTLEAAVRSGLRAARQITSL